jgi:hypothetical protein
VAGTCDGQQVKLYVDGVLIGSAPSEPNYIGTPASVRIGGVSCCAGNNFGGLVDEPGIYSRALDDDEIAGLVRAGKRGRCGQFGLFVRRFIPTGPVNTNVARLELQFNQPIQLETFTKEDVTLSGPNGVVPSAGFTVNQIAPMDRRTFEVLIPNQATDGTYQVTIGPNILDLAGNPMIANVGRSGSTILTFEPPKANRTVISQTYGDRVTAIEQGGFRYGSGGTPATANITVGYGPAANDVKQWTTGYGDLTDVLYRDAEGVEFLKSRSPPMPVSSRLSTVSTSAATPASIA